MRDRQAVKVLSLSRWSGYALAMLCLTATPVIAATDFDHMIGTYLGQWNNITFGSSGDAKFIIDVNETTSMMSVTMDMDGNVFGGLDPDPTTAAGLISGNMVNFNVTGDPTYGDIDATITSTGNLTSTMTNIPGGGITSVDVIGTVNNGRINANYTVNFQFGDPAIGTVSADIPEPASLALLSISVFCLLNRKR